MVLAQQEVSKSVYQEVVIQPHLYTYRRCVACHILLAAIKADDCIKPMHTHLTTPLEVVTLRRLLGAQSLPLLVMPDGKKIEGLLKISKQLGVTV
jgi:hypothetical protein